MDDLKSEAVKALEEGSADDRNKPEVKKFLKVMTDWQTTYKNHFNTLDLIQRELLETYEIGDPRRTARKLAGWILHMALYKTRRQFKPLDFMLFSAGADPNERTIQQGLLEDALEKAGYARTETYGFGNLDRQIIFGDSFKGFGPTPNLKFPFGYWTQDASRVMFNIDANIMRNPGSEREARQSVIVREFTAETAVKIAPQIKGKAKLGMLPDFQQDGKRRDMTPEQKAFAEKGLIQFAYCNDIDERYYQVLVGANAFQMLIAKDKLYPFVNDAGDPYINLSHKRTFNNPEGLLNFGLGHLLYRLNILERVLINKGATYTIQNSNPPRIVSVATGKEKDFLRQLRKARRAEAKGDVPVIWNKDGKDFGGVKSLRTDVIIDEMNALLSIINDNILIPLSINLRDTSTNPNKTFGAIEYEAEASSEFVSDIQDSNAPETKFEMEQLVDFCKMHVKDDNPIPLRARKKIRSDATGKPLEVNGPSGADSFTLGDMAKTFRARTWEIIINDDSGVKRSRSLDIARHERMLNRMLPGSAAWTKTMRSLGKLEGHQFEDEDFAVGQQEAGGEAQPKELKQPF